MLHLYYTGEFMQQKIIQRVKIYRVNNSGGKYTTFPCMNGGPISGCITFYTDVDNDMIETRNTGDEIGRVNKLRNVLISNIEMIGQSQNLGGGVEFFSGFDMEFEEISNTL